MTDRPLILCFRRDLRLSDNPALTAAAVSGRSIVPVFILEGQAGMATAPGAAARWWLHGSLDALARDLTTLGSRLVLRRGAAADVLDRLIAETGADAVHWNRRYDAAGIAADAALKASLKARGLAVASHNASLLAEPWTVATGNGAPYRVFTPFWRAARERMATASNDQAAIPKALPAPAGWPDSERLEDWGLTPRAPDWAAGLRAGWTPGEAGAAARLNRFRSDALAHYADGRDRPGEPGTSRLSPHLARGDIGPRQVWHAVAHRGEAGVEAGDAARESYLREIAWREFCYHLLYHFPEMTETPLDTRFAAFPWAADPDRRHFSAWRRGRTGYPIVDAGMRELWTTGWMHNRVRMVAASFLVKHLLLPWQEGEAWFRDCLVDADAASNAAGWQWVAGCGADAAPYFRVFNPVLQGEKFDAHGAYVRRWVPELTRLPDRWLHKPWSAPPLVLQEAGVRLGRDYPPPIVDHAVARIRALAAYDTIKTRRAA